MGNNIAAAIVKVWTLAKTWCPNFVKAEEMRHINEVLGEALRENAKRNDMLQQYRTALEASTVLLEEVHLAYSNDWGMNWDRIPNRAETNRRILAQ